MKRFFQAFSKNKKPPGQIGIYANAKGLTFAYVAPFAEKSMLKHWEHWDETCPVKQQSLLRKKIASLHCYDVHATLLLSEEDYQIFLIQTPQVPEDQRNPDFAIKNG